MSTGSRALCSCRCPPFSCIINNLSFLVNYFHQHISTLYFFSLHTHSLISPQLSYPLLNSLHSAPFNLKITNDLHDAKSKQSVFSLPQLTGLLSSLQRHDLIHLEILTFWASRFPHSLLIFPPHSSLLSPLGLVHPLQPTSNVGVPRGSVFTSPHHQTHSWNDPLSLRFEGALDNTQISICNPNVDSRCNGWLPTQHLHWEVKKTSQT